MQVKTESACSFVSKRKRLIFFGTIAVILIAIFLHKDKAESNSPFRKNDSKQFLVVVNEKYDEEDLIEWSPMPAPISHPDEPGDLGQAVVVPPDLQEEAKDRFEEHEFNIVANELMSYNRTTKDLRFKECLGITYPKKMPSVSIIIVFHNEAWATLIRTVWSVVSQTPRELLKEIILVDDMSDMEHLGQRLEEYLPQFPVEVNLQRMPERKGLIQARLLGVKHATAKILVFLDAHCECNQGWLEPLVAAVVERRTRVAVPIIDIIKFQDMHIDAAVTTSRGVFDLTLAFTWQPIPDDEKAKLGNDRTAWTRPPAMAGGLFAIDKEYFHKLGEYDPKMIIWGGENIEMSLRIWMCGGEIVSVPCSRVGHIFRDHTPYELPGGFDNIIYNNQARTVDVWLDDHKHIYYSFNPEAIKRRTDASDRLTLREQLQCKSFQWYLDNIFTESSFRVKYKSISQIESLGIKSRCVDTMGRRIIGNKMNISKCHKWGGNQGMMFTELNEIRPRKYCLDATSANEPIAIFDCHTKGGNQYWKYDEATKTIVHQSANCLTAVEPDQITIMPCDGRPTQKWKLNDIEYKGEL